MVVGNLYVVRPIRLPNKANAVLIIDSDAVLPLSIPAERLQSICWRNAKIVQVNGCLNLVEFAQSHRFNCSPTLVRARFKEQPCIAVFEGLNHMLMI